MAGAREVILENVGPVQRLRVPIPEGGGVVVITGRNGSGKSTSIEAVESLVTGKGRPSVRDGALRGEVHGLGVLMKVARSCRRTGELEVQSLEGRLSVAELVDPQLANAEAADAKRIKALVALTGATARTDLFEPLLGGREAFDRVVGPAAAETDDVVLMASRVKRDVETAARSAEDQAKTADAHAQAKREAARDILGGTLPEVLELLDDTAVQAELVDAVRAESAAKTAVLEATQKLKAAEQSAAWLLARSAENLPASGELETALQAAVLRAEDAERLAAEAESRARQLRHEASVAAAELAGARANLEAGKARGAQLEAARANVAAAEGVNLVELEVTARAAGERVARARAEGDRAVLVRKAAEQIGAADGFDADRARHAAHAQRLRDAAAGVDEVLSGLVAAAGVPIRVEAGRLVVDTPTRGATYFADLSHGERWRLSLEIATKAVGSGGLLPIPQDAWEGLDPQNRDMVAGIARASGVVILTAEATDAPAIDAQVYAAGSRG